MNEKTWTGIAIGVFAMMVWNYIWPSYPRGSVAYMAPRTMSANTPELIMAPAANTDAARADVILMCGWLEQFQDEGVDPVNHRWCKPL